MTEYEWSAIVVHTVAIPAFTGLIRFRRILTTDRPVAVLYAVALFNTSLMLFLARTIHNNIVAVNFYELFEAIITPMVFYKWGAFSRRRWVYRSIQLLLVLSWLGENHNVADLFVRNLYFPITYSSVIVFMGIDRINAILITERRDLLKNGRFVLAVILVASSCFEAMQDLFFLFDVNFSYTFYDRLLRINLAVALVVNIVSAWGIRRLPEREIFTLPAG